MAMSDPLGDMLTRIRNGQRARLSSVKSPASKMRESVLKVLESQGFIRGYKVEEVRKGISELTIELKYHDGDPVIRELDRVSTPGRRVFTKINDLRPFRNGLGVQIISTSSGVMADGEARARNVGGEVLCRIF
ncbi:MAG: 30S ribosomal protein S8 [Rhodospirillaceae bacterium]|jgi:small subunit ribosomal protein S8|nr:30S ribosomal protein S8 [Alphaproteobacteria bacterium]MEC7141526.1 30S ribosomal protein S8 [Pseudomonadota bacterium]MEC8275038.1 30S ribosomal protein S8 [Pseudomonadota bacterium]CAI8293558.1 MAG: 30S ribosomal protein S8 [Rhodospirillaceae bacterium]HCI00291.1 30S ribosomal protein S8 [Alphaproteobacteria bacterium]